MVRDRRGGQCHGLRDLRRDARGGLRGHVHLPGADRLFGAAVRGCPAQQPAGAGY